MQRNIRKKRKLGSYPFVSVTFSTALALFVIGLFGLIALQVHKLTEIIQQSIEIQVFLKKQIGPSEVTRIYKTIGNKHYVLKEDNQPKVRLVSKEEAVETFIAETGEDFKEFLGDNPLRDALIVNIDPQFQSAEFIRGIKTDLEGVRGVYEVAYVESLVESIEQNLAKIGLILVGLFVILLMVVIVLINNTIKLALFSQRFLIRSMQLVGATPSFIRRPFLARAAVYGLVAGATASGLLSGLLYYANMQIEELAQLQDSQSLAIFFGALVVLGILVGYFSTLYATRKYLKMSLDELY